MANDRRGPVLCDPSSASKNDIVRHANFYRVRVIAGGGENVSVGEKRKVGWGGGKTHHDSRSNTRKMISSETTKRRKTKDAREGKIGQDNTSEEKTTQDKTPTRQPQEKTKTKMTTNDRDKDDGKG
jgi:hypothetical protein